MRLLLGVAFAGVLVALVLAVFLVPVPAIQGGIVGGLLGLLGSQVALFVARYLRERGEVILEVKGWVGSSRGVDSEGAPLSEESVLQIPDHFLQTVREERQFEVRLRNTKDVSIPVWDFSVVFSRGGEPVRYLDPHNTLTGFRLDLLNIPAQEAVLRVVRVSVSESPEKLRQVYEADKVKMIATVAGEGQLSRELPRWSAPDIRP